MKKFLTVLIIILSCYAKNKSSFSTTQQNMTLDSLVDEDKKEQEVDINGIPCFIYKDVTYDLISKKIK